MAKQNRLVQVPIENRPESLTAKQAATLGVIVERTSPGLGLTEIRDALGARGLPVRRPEIWAIVRRLHKLGLVMFTDRRAELADLADPRQTIWVIPTGPGRLAAHSWARLFGPFVQAMELPTPEEKQHEARPKPATSRGRNRRQK